VINIRYITFLKLEEYNMLIRKPNFRKYALYFLFAVLLILTIGSCNLLSYIEIHNMLGSGETIRYVYIRDAGSVDWGEDLLDGDTILPGSSHSFEVGSGTFDVWVIDFSGWDATIEDVNVDSGSTTTLDYDGINLF
jgi:hypothetical protein